MMSVLLFPMWLLSGSFFPATQGSLLSYLVMINPLTYGVAGLRHDLGGTETIEGAWLPGAGLSWGISIAFAVAMLFAATKVVNIRTKGDLK